MKLFLHFNWEFLKTYNMQIYISVWQFNWTISEGVVVLFENPPTFYINIQMYTVSCSKEKEYGRCFCVKNNL